MPNTNSGSSELPAPLLEEIEQLPARYPLKRGALLPILQRMQDHRTYLTPADLTLAASLTDLSPAEVYSVMSFYTMFRMKPAGKFPLGICRNFACWLVGCRDIVDTVRAQLGVAAGEVTEDGRFSFEEVECLGSCGTGPALEINGEYHENLTPDKVRQLITELSKDG